MTKRSVPESYQFLEKKPSSLSENKNNKNNLFSLFHKKIQTTNFSSFLLFYVILLIYIPLDLPPKYLADISSQIICIFFSLFLLYKSAKTDNETIHFCLPYTLFSLLYLNVIKIIIVTLIMKKEVVIPIGLIHLLILLSGPVVIILFSLNIFFCIFIQVVSLGFLIWTNVKFSKTFNESNYNYVVEYSLCILEPAICYIYRFEDKNFKINLENQIFNLKQYFCFFSNVVHEIPVSFIVYNSKNYCLQNKKIKSYLIEFDSLHNNQLLSEALLVNNEPNWNDLSHHFFQNMEIQISDNKNTKIEHNLNKKSLHEIVLYFSELEGTYSKEYTLIGIATPKEEVKKYGKQFIFECRKGEEGNGNWVEIMLREVNDGEHASFESTRSDLPHYSTQEKANMFSKLVHEFKTPLICISQLIKEVKISKNEESTNIKIDDIDNFVNYSLLLVHDIINYFTISSISTYQIIKQPFRLSDSLNFVYNILKTLLKYSNNKLVSIKPILNFSQDYIVTNGDCFRLNQILINFISNAVKFTKGGSISIRAERDPESENDLKISVDDTGCGLTPELLNSFRDIKLDKYLPSSLGISKELGSGLGLIISKHIASLLDWKMGVNSTFNEGSSFFICIPISNCVEIEKSERVLHNPTANKRSSQSFLSAVTQKRTLYKFPTAIPFTKKKPPGLHSHFNLNERENIIIDESYTSNSNTLCENENFINSDEQIDDPDLNCILVIDDHLLMINSIILVLKQLFSKFHIKKYRIIKGYDGADLIKEITKDQTKQKIKLTLIDEDMEYLNGTDAVRIVRKLEEGGKIKKNCICLTSAINTVSPSNEKLFDYFIEKPIKIFELEKLFKKQFGL